MAQDHGFKLSARRMHMGLRQQDVADRVGVNRASVSMWESGKTSPNVRHAAALIKVLDLPPLFFGVDLVSAEAHDAAAAAPTNNAEGGEAATCDCPTKCDACSAFFDPGPMEPDENGKLPVDLVPVRVIAAVARVMGYGAKKHGERGWQDGRSWTGEYASAMRHLMEWRLGSNADAETEQPPLAHAIARLMILLDMELREVGADDREGGA